MYELHENEQYFFDRPTLTHMAGFISAYPNPCCICCPLLGRELTTLGVPVRILDIDERFSDLPGFRRYDLHRPEWLGEEFGIIVCDPPFYNLSLSRLFAGLRLLSRNLYTQPLLVSYLVRRSSGILGTFSRFNLEPTNYRPTYQTVQKVPRNEIEFYGNLGPEAHHKLATPI